MQDLERMAIFARVVEAKSFSRAARELGLSKSLISKQITELEKSLGARLLNRTTRALSLTDAGSVFCDYCVRIIEERDEARLAVSHLQSEPRGLLRVSSSVAFGRLHLAPALAEFLARYPELKIDMVTTDRLVDLAEERYDVVIRIAGEPASNVVARKIAPVNRRMCATPDYLARHGVPKCPADLGKHNCLTYTYLNPQGFWRLHGPEGSISIQVPGNLRLNDDDALAEAVLSGVGIALLPTFIVGKELQQGRLRSVMTEYVPLERSIYAVYLPTHHVPAKVRSFIDYLLARFGPEPYWDHLS